MGGVSDGSYLLDHITPAVQLEEGRCWSQSESRQRSDFSIMQRKERVTESVQLQHNNKDIQLRQRHFADLLILNLLQS